MLFTNKTKVSIQNVKVPLVLLQIWMHWSVSLGDSGEEAGHLGLGVGGCGVVGEVRMGRAKKTFTATLWSPGTTEGHCSEIWCVQLLTLAAGLRSLSVQAALLQ